MLFSTIWIPRLIFPGIHCCGAFPVGDASCNLQEELTIDKENLLQEPVSLRPAGTWSACGLQKHGQPAACRSVVSRRLQERGQTMPCRSVVSRRLQERGQTTPCRSVVSLWPAGARKPAAFVLKAVDPGGRAGSMAAHTVVCASKDSGICSHVQNLRELVHI